MKNADIRRKKRQKSKRNNKNKVRKVSVYEECKIAKECLYVNSCPRVGNRICNSNATCCRKCTEGIFCNMREK